MFPANFRVLNISARSGLLSARSRVSVIAATSAAAALDAVPNVAGSASALMGSLQYGSGIISSFLLALAGDGTPWTMAWIIALFTLISAGIALTTRVVAVADN